MKPLLDNPDDWLAVSSFFIVSSNQPEADQQLFRPTTPAEGRCR
jgi:hypothetical protein